MDQNTKNNLRKWLTVIAIIGLAFWGGMKFQQYQNPPPSKMPVDADFSIVWDVWNQLENKYVGSLDKEKMVYGAAKGLTAALEDPYTVFLEPEMAKALNEDISGKFEGVGMVLDVKDSQLVVVSPIKGTPAYKAGVKAGDKILKINGTSTQDIQLDQAVKFIRGPKGTKITITILRGALDAKNIKEIELTRDVINVPSVELEYKKNKNNEEIAVIKVTQFQDNTVQEFEKILQEVMLKKSKRIIIDLRNNPGGLLDQAQAVAQYFLKSGDPIVYEGNSKIMPEVPYISQIDGPFRGYPLVVLINQGSASGAEILAAALSENGAAKLVGENSFGKGSVQLPQMLRSKSMLKVTIAQWMTPKRNIIDKKGIKPDIEVKITEEDVKNEKDPQMEKAIEIVSEMQ